MKPSQVFSQARVILNDPAGVAPRWSDDDLLAYYNDFRKSLARGKGELFSELIELDLLDGEVQSVSRVSTFGLLDVLKNKTGGAVREVDRDTMALQAPAWRSAAKAPMKVWMRLKADAFRFLCFPPATAGDTAQVLVVQVPADIDIANKEVDDGINDAYRSSAASYVAGMALTVNTNAADTQKGIGLLNAAMSMAGIGS